MSTLRLHTSTLLEEALSLQVLELARRAAETDGVDAISESFRLALRTSRPGVTHVLADDGGSRPLGYAARDAAGSAELVVDPGSRRQGAGRALLRALLKGGVSGVWAHGDLPAAQALAAAEELVPTRKLHVMSRRLTEHDATNPALPEGFSVRSFEVGRDEHAWLEINALAFASHPEQGAITLEDLQERMSQEWFDPAGFFLLEDTSRTDTGGGHPLAAFHWTKREPGSSAGEVYVVGVHPAYQSRGLAGPVTALGTAHLARQGVERVDLYVDGDNARALATYRRAGFEDTAIHVVYGRPGEP